MARLENGERKMMSDLRVGDSILAVDHLGKMIFSPIILFLQKDPLKQGRYYKIQTRAGHFLEISSSHLIYIRPQVQKKNQLIANLSDTYFVSKTKKLGEVINGQLGSFSLMFASNVKEGDEVLVYDGKDGLKSNEVISIKPIPVNGAYAPLTLQGNLFVEDVLASSYASYDNHNMVHALFAPYRWWYEISKYLPETIVGKREVESEEENGTHWYAQALKSMGNYMNMIPRQPYMGR